MKETTTPLMQQYLQIKKKFSEEIVFFQVGDFYELFFEDAKIAANLLHITLTKRGIYNGEHIPLCGVPIHMIENYYPKLLKHGYTIVICNQNEIAQAGKLVNRIVSDIITPSTVLNQEADEHIYSLFISMQKNTIQSFWFEFGRQEILYHRLDNNQTGKLTFASLFQTYAPREIITEQTMIEQVYQLIPTKKNIKTVVLTANSEEINAFLSRYKLSIEWESSTNIFLSYMKRYFDTLINNNYFFFKEISYDKNVFLDKATIKYLECVVNTSDGGKGGTLYDILDKTKTKMGSRLLKEWILNPVKQKETILDRQKIITACLAMPEKTRESIQENIQSFGDMERFCHKLRLKKLKNKDLPKLKLCIEAWHNFIYQYQTTHLMSLFPIDPDTIDSMIIKIITDTILAKEFITIENNTHYINPKTSESLYQLYQTIFEQETAVKNILESEKKASGIEELVIKNTPLYGFTFELSKVKDNKYKIPDYFKRVQTLSLKERYQTPALVNFSQQSDHAYFLYCQEEERIKNNFFETIINALNQFFTVIEKIKYLDVCFSLVTVAWQNRWVCPEITDIGKPLHIIDGKHPVLAHSTNSYVANSLELTTEKKMIMITGPNMGGKSTYMRQNALIILLAHIGSYIPAKKAYIPIMEKILTRVGASDSMLEGKSTFYLELEELQTIVTLANEHSFVIIDEIGRGTSTYDGMSLAASIIEHLATKNKPYALCATHYHELANLLYIDSLRWCSMKAMVEKNDIYFLYRMVDGVGSDSMGILLAKKIGFPETIINTANTYFEKIKSHNI